MSENVTADSLKIFVATVISFFIGMVINVGIARGLGPDGKGIFSVVMSLAGLLTLVVDSGFSISLVYFVGRRKFRTKDLLGYSVLWGGAAGLAIALIAWLVKDAVILKVLRNVLPLQLALALGLVVLGVQGNFSSAILRGQYRMRMFSLLLVLRPALQCVFVYLVFILHRFSVASVLACFVLSYAVTAVVGYLLIANRDGAAFVPRFGPVRELLVFGTKGQLGNIIQFFNYRFDLFLVNYFLSATQVGLYSVSVNVVEMLWFIPNSFAITLFSKVAALPVEESNRLTGHILRISFLLTFIAGIGLFGLGGLIITLLFGRQFSGSVRPLLVLLPGILGMTISKILSSDLAGRGKPQYVTYISVISVILTLGFDFLLIPRIGIIGAALASSIAYIAAGVSSVVWFNRESRVPLREILAFRRSDFTLVAHALRFNRTRP